MLKAPHIAEWPILPKHRIKPQHHHKTLIGQFLMAVAIVSSIQCLMETTW
jgi:hypothetical protein